MSKDLMRLSQLVTSFGPGAMIDLPKWSVMIAGLDRWDRAARRKVVEPRLVRRLPDGPSRGLATPPIHEESPYRRDAPKLQAIVFPTWFVTVEGERVGEATRRRLLRFGELDQSTRRSVEGSGRNQRRWSVAPVRFVAACENGHVQDIDWRIFVHRGEPGDGCGPLWLEERGAVGDLAEAKVVCACGAERALYEALAPQTRALGPCRGQRPWLGPDAAERCDKYLRLLVRTASHAYFPITVTALSLPEDTPEKRLERLVEEHWGDLQEIAAPADLASAFRFNTRLKEAFEGIEPGVIFAAIERRRSGEPSPKAGPKLKPEEFAVLATRESRPEERANRKAPLVTERLPRDAWDPTGRFSVVEQLVLVHRLRVVTALAGFTRFDFPTADKDGELDSEPAIQALSRDPEPYPAIEQFGEGLFLRFAAERVDAWLDRPEVKARAERLREAQRRWAQERGLERIAHPGPAFVALHTLAHMLLAEIALEGGYPLASLHERVYAGEGGAYGILLYAGSLDVGGTLGGLVSLGPRMGRLLERAIEQARLCSNDPVCAEHDPTRSDKGAGNPLSGAACHGCVLLPEPCCETRNDFLDRALAVGTLAHSRLGLLEPGTS